MSGTARGPATKKSRKMRWYVQTPRYSSSSILRSDIEFDFSSRRLHLVKFYFCLESLYVIKTNFTFWLKTVHIGQVSFSSQNFQVSESFYSL